MEKVPLIIIGSGPAGYTAGVYASRARLEPILFAGHQSGGQLMNTSDIENFPGFEAGINGPQLMATMRAQAEHFGTKIIDDLVTKVDFSARPFKVWVGETEYQAEAVIVSTGATSIMLNVPGEQEFLGRGVSTCAVCDAAFYREKNVFVVGGGDSAMEDTLALTKFAKTVTVIHRRDSFKASKIMQERVLHDPKVKVLWNSQLKAVLGQTTVNGVQVETMVDGAPQVQELPADGVFIAIGHKPTTEIFKGHLELDNAGYLVTRQSPSRRGAELAQAALDENSLVLYPTMTSVEGVFGAGDVVDLRYRQAVTAAGQGAAAAIDAERWLEDPERLAGK